MQAWADGATLTEEAVIAQLGNSPRELFCSELALSEPASVELAADTGTIVLTYASGDVWDESSLICDGSHVAYSSTRSMFVNPTVQAVEVRMTTEVIDGLGNSSDKVVLSSTIQRSLADQIEWDGLGDRLEGEPEWWFCLADATVPGSATIDPMLVSGLDSSSCWFS